jgi:ATP synthase protein I
MPDDRQQKYKDIYEAATLGIMFPAAIVVGYLMGWGLDYLFGTRFWCRIVFTILGIAAAFVNLFREGMKDDGGTPPSAGS